MGSLLLGQHAITQLEAGFEADARDAYRLINQRAGQHDALLSTMALLRNGSDPARPEQRLQSVYPQIVAVQRREAAAAWPLASQGVAEAESRKLGRPVLTEPAIAQGRYQLVMAGEPVSYAVQIDVRGMVPWGEWPMAAETSPVRVTLEHASKAFVLQQGEVPADGARGWDFSFVQTLTSASQPFRHRGPAPRGLGRAALEPDGGLVAVRGAAAAGRPRAAAPSAPTANGPTNCCAWARWRASIPWVNSLRAWANDLNQPVAELLTNARIAGSVLQEDPPDLYTGQLAVQAVLGHAQRVSDVLNRLRFAVSQPNKEPAHGGCRPAPAGAPRPCMCWTPNCAGTASGPASSTTGNPISVLGDPGALEQIMHNLLLNALQALDQVQINDRHLVVSLSKSDQHGHFIVRDTGPGMPTEVLPRVFEPFFTTREGGLGLGLTLSESMAHDMDGTLTAFNQVPHGAEFRLSVPLAAPH